MAEVACPVLSMSTSEILIGTIKWPINARLVSSSVQRVTNGSFFSLFRLFLVAVVFGLVWNWTRTIFFSSLPKRKLHDRCESLSIREMSKMSLFVSFSPIGGVLLQDMHTLNCLCEGKERKAIGGFLSTNWDTYQERWREVHSRTEVF